MKKRVPGLMIVAVLILTNCTPMAQPAPAAAADGLRIEHWSAGIGSFHGLSHAL
jgi:hypothetical protein